MEWSLERGVSHRELYLLFDRAARGEEIVFLRDGLPLVRLLAAAADPEEREAERR